MNTRPMPNEAREAIIEHRRAMKAQRKWARENRAQIDAEWDALPARPTIGSVIAEAKARLGEAEFARRVESEWRDPVGVDRQLVEQG